MVPDGPMRRVGRRTDARATGSTDVAHKFCDASPHRNSADSQSAGNSPFLRKKEIRARRTSHVAHWQLALAYAGSSRVRLVPRRERDQSTRSASRPRYSADGRRCTIGSTSAATRPRCAPARPRRPRSASRSLQRPADMPIIVASGSPPAPWPRSRTRRKPHGGVRFVQVDPHRGRGMRRAESSCAWQQAGCSEPRAMVRSGRHADARDVDHDQGEGPARRVAEGLREAR